MTDLLTAALLKRADEQTSDVSMLDFRDPRQAAAQPTMAAEGRVNDADRKAQALALIDRMRSDVEARDWQSARLQGLKLRLLLEPATAPKPGSAPPKPWSETPEREPGED